MNLQRDWPLGLIALLGATTSFNIAAVNDVLPVSIQHYAILGLAVFSLVNNKK